MILICEFLILKSYHERVVSIFSMENNRKMYHYWGHITSETMKSAGALNSDDYRRDEGVASFSNWLYTHANIVKFISLSKLSVPG